jgi:hypothetical protein
MPEPAGGIHIHNFARKALRRAWRTLSVFQGAPTASILRYTMTGGDAFAGIAPTPALVANLSGLRVVENRPEHYGSESRGPAKVQLREGDREFWFLDIPAAGGVDANMLLATDVIDFEGRHWAPLEGTIDNATLIGSSFAFCRLVGRDG